MLDEDTKIALDLEFVSWPTSRQLKHRLIAGLGYKPLQIECASTGRPRPGDARGVMRVRGTGLGQPSPIQLITARPVWCSPSHSIPTLPSPAYSSLAQRSAAQSDRMH